MRGENIIKLVEFNWDFFFAGGGINFVKINWSQRRGKSKEENQKRWAFSLLTENFLCF